MTTKIIASLAALERLWQEAYERRNREQTRDACRAFDAIDESLCTLPCATCGHEYGDHENGRGACAPRVDGDCGCSEFVERTPSGLPRFVGAE